MFLLLKGGIKRKRGGQYKAPGAQNVVWELHERNKETTS